MPNITSQDADKLSQSSTFVGRLAILLDAEAMVVLRETSSTPNHAVRANLALTVLHTPDSCASVYAKELVFDTNLIGAGFTLDQNNNPLDSNAADGAIRSQISTNWNIWCGIPQ